jgi:predicted AAA+ superfamily ATPase
MKERPAYVKIWETLAADKGMVFLSGPRQAGKTTLAKSIADGFPNTLYCNWDIPEHRLSLLQDSTFFTSLPRRDSSRPFVIFDEIHKYREWKNYLKEVYDQFVGEYQFLITGSGRLDLYQKGGDSLAGRYLLFHLWPFTAGELGGIDRPLNDFLSDPLVMTMDQAAAHAATWEGLEALSGFPEPFLRGRAASYRRWSANYSQRLIRDDIRELTEIRSVTDMETLYHLLPSKVGSPISAPSLANDLRVTYNTVQNWLAMFERFFLTFSLPTWTRQISRAIQKERKVYLFDAPRIKDPAARFENMVAIELWRAISCWNAMGAGEFTLHFIRNKEQQEVDFLIANEREPFLLVECKLVDEQPAKSLLAMQRALQAPAVQLVRTAAPGFRTYRNGDHPVLVAPASQWCAGLPK